MSDPTSEKIGLCKHLPEFEEHATAIGWVCLHLAALESLLDRCIWVMIELQDERAMNCIAGNCDLSQKVQMAKGLSFLHKQGKWFERVRAILDGFRNLQDRRNRFVHDDWGPDESGFVRIRKVVSLKKPQSFQPTALTTMEGVPIKAEEIWGLVRDLDTAYSDLFSTFTEEFGLVLDPRPNS